MAVTWLECKCTHRGFQAKAEVAGLSQGQSAVKKSFRKHICGLLQTSERLNKDILQHEGAGITMNYLPRQKAHNLHL